MLLSHNCKATSAFLMHYSRHIGKRKIYSQKFYIASKCCFSVCFAYVPFCMRILFSISITTTSETYCIEEVKQTRECGK